MEFCLSDKHHHLVPTQLFYVFFPFIPLIPYFSVTPRGLLKHLQIPRVFHNQVGISFVGQRPFQLVVFPKILVLFRFVVENSNRLQRNMRHLIQDEMRAESPRPEC